MDEVLAAWGLDPNGMILDSTLRASDDRRVFVGSGWLPGDATAHGRAWIAGVPWLAPPAPEPGALAPLGVGLIGLVARRLRRARR